MTVGPSGPTKTLVTNKDPPKTFLSFFNKGVSPSKFFTSFYLERTKFYLIVYCALLLVMIILPHPDGTRLDGISLPTKFKKLHHGSSNEK